jgi:glucosamine 6-phosphate synthetase-like amidotransferase/phosphosugar isomerase protein
MDPVLYPRDLELKPATLRALADRLGDVVWPIEAGQRIVLAGMGSSWFAADTMARRLRRVGVHAVAEFASVEATYPASADLAVVGITASGGSAETLGLLRAHHGTSVTIACTNTEGLALPTDHTVLMYAEPEPGGVACRSYVHTLAVLLQLEHQLTGSLPDLAGSLRHAADASEHLLQTRSEWLPELAAVLDGPHGTWLMAPAERLGNSLQGALMLREGPRRVADGCETGDWSHVDVYLTKSMDYRALMFSGSPHDGTALNWLRERGSKFVAVGATASTEAAYVLRYPHDDDPVVALLTEVLVPELVSAHWWTAG